MTRPIDVGEIVQMLASRAPELAATLLPGGVREGHEWRAGSLAGDRGRSLAVHLDGPRAGIWADFAAGPDMRGDALDLVAHAVAGGDKKRAIAWSRAWLGLDHADHRQLEQRRREVQVRRAESDRAAAAEDARFRAAAQAIFLSAQLKLEGTPVQRYLAGRGLDLAAAGVWPRALRFHPALNNRESGRAWPAMVAAITAPDGAFAGVHRTWLEIHDDGRVTKAPLRDPKLTLGRYAGGCIRLWRPKSLPPLHRARAGEGPALIAEGIEDGLTGALAAPERRALVAVSLSNLTILQLPAAIDQVQLLAQNDPPESQAARSLERAIARFQAEGRTVWISRPPAGCKDFNQLQQQGEGAA